MVHSRHGGELPSIVCQRNRSYPFVLKIDNFLSNYSSALRHAVTLDTKIMSDAANLRLTSNSSSPYQNLVALNLRQTMGALEFTTSVLANGTLAGTSDVRVFMKDVGNSR
jgi:NAD/NADP transhydrogenase beta subunit